jgi:hypothetical protein
MYLQSKEAGFSNAPISATFEVMTFPGLYTISASRVIGSALGCRIQLLKFGYNEKISCRPQI